MLKKFLVIIIGAALSLMSTAVFAKEIIRYHGSSTILRAIMYSASNEFEKQESVKFDLKGKSTGVGIEKLLAGECDIAGGGRPLRESEKAKGLVEQKVFIDAYAIIVNKKNPITQISTGDFSKLITGKITSWGDLGWESKFKIRIIAPPKKSAHYKNLKKQLGFDQLPQGVYYADMTPAVIQGVENLYTNIGWLSYANVANQNHVNILKVISNGEPVEINQANLQSGKYPYSQGMYFYTMGEPTGNLKKFISFIKGEKGEELITKAHFFLP